MNDMLKALSTTTQLLLTTIFVIVCLGTTQVIAVDSTYGSLNGSLKATHNHDQSHPHLLLHHDQSRHGHHNHSVGSFINHTHSNNHPLIDETVADAATNPLQLPTPSFSSLSSSSFSSSNSNSNTCRPEDSYDYIVTGGAGFIGSNLIKRLLSVNPSYRIRVVDNLWRGSLKNLKYSNYR